MTKATVSIVMELDFDKVVDDERQRIQAEVAELIGCQQTDLGNARFSRGCLKLEFEVDEEIAEVFAALFKKAAEGGDAGEELQTIRSFMAARQVASVNLLRQSRVALRGVRYGPMRAGDAAHRDEPGQDIVMVHGWSGKPESFGLLPAAAWRSSRTAWAA